MSDSFELINKTAIEVVSLLRKEEISPSDLLLCLQDRIELIDGQVNALPTLCFERAFEHANRLEKKPVEERGILAGLPIPIKDLTPVEGILFTSGSTIFKDRIATHSDMSVKRIEAQGGIVYAKSNTPEFGAGGNTFNNVFGKTLNPWDLRMSTAGSSGGSAAALASGMAWLAHGSDMGGSLRNPASFCGVVGMRPSPGRVAHGPSLLPFNSLGVQGPMARNIADLALFFDVMTGADYRDPLSFSEFKISFLEAAKLSQKPAKIAFSADFGFMPVDTEVAEICREAAKKIQEFGIIVEDCHPKLDNVIETFWTLRSHSFAMTMGPLVKQFQDHFKQELLDNINVGYHLSVDELGNAETSRAMIYEKMFNFFDEYDLLLAPSTIVPAFPIEQRFVKKCNDKIFNTYVDWMGITFPATLGGCPALSIPAGFTKKGLPVGLQLISRQKSEAKLLSSAQAIEDILGKNNLPIDPRPNGFLST